MTFRKGWKDFTKACLADIKRLIRSSDTATANDGVDVAKELSSGTHSTKELRRYRPGAYALARSSPMFDPDIINKQKGNFYRGWHARYNIGPKKNPGIENDSKEAQFLEASTKAGYRGKMVARRVDYAILTKLRPMRIANLDSVFKRKTPSP